MQQGDGGGDTKPVDGHASWFRQLGDRRSGVKNTNHAGPEDEETGQRADKAVSTANGTYGCVEVRIVLSVLHVSCCCYCSSKV